MFDCKLLGVLLAALTLACGAPPETPVEVVEEASEVPAADTAGAEVSEVAPTAPGSTRFELGEGTRVYYRVREQLVGVSFLNDAVGVSDGISGAIVVGSDGSVDSSQSRLTLDLSTFSSDQARRDNFVRRRLFEVEQHPEAVFVARSASSSPLPPENPETLFPIVGFQLVGDMTLHGVTDEITWDVLATYNDEGVVEGKAQTNFSFSKFNLTTPELPFLLTVEDEIRLEIDFKVSRL
jgi:polyisoprenoid-binding protein YceI